MIEPPVSDHVSQRIEMRLVEMSSSVLAPRALAELADIPSARWGGERQLGAGLVTGLCDREPAADWRPHGQGLVFPTDSWLSPQIASALRS